MPPLWWRGIIMQHNHSGPSGQHKRHLCTKFEADRSIYSKVIRGLPNFRHWVTWPKPRPIGGRFMVVRRRGRPSMSVPNLETERVYSFNLEPTRCPVAGARKWQMLRKVGAPSRLHSSGWVSSGVHSVRVETP